jgi:aspartyl-tRNA(Asn)/glutamyl-tRNA(Gln) amidotransferase subunit A
MAADVAGAARGLEMLTGQRVFVPPDSADPIESFRVAVPRGWVQDLDSSTEATWRDIAVGLPTIEFPERARLTATFNRIAGHEAGAVHREWVERWPERYGADVLQRLRDGLQVSAEEYELALTEREVARRDAAEALSEWDAMMLPATACVAPRLDDPDRREPLTRFLRGFSVTGQPVVVVPAPTEGLPVGVQFVGHPGQDAALLRLARAFESAWAHARSRVAASTTE